MKTIDFFSYEVFNQPPTSALDDRATSLHFVAAGEHLEVMDELRERGTDIDAQKKGGI